MGHFDDINDCASQSICAIHSRHRPLALSFPPFVLAVNDKKEPQRLPSCRRLLVIDLAMSGPM